MTTVRIFIIFVLAVCSVISVAFASETYPDAVSVMSVVDDAPSSSSMVGNDECRILFQKFVKDHDKHYDTAAQREYRFKVFCSNLDVIDRHNNNHNNQVGENSSSTSPSFQLGITQFADRLTNELPLGHDKSQSGRYSKSTSLSSTTSFLRGQGVVGSSDEMTNIQNVINFFPNNELLDVSTLPKEVDWRNLNNGDPITTPIKNQRSCGSCWAFATTATLESHVALKTGTLLELSVQELVSCVPNPRHCGGSGGCAGSTAEIAFDFISKHGMVDEWAFGYASGDGSKVNCTITNQQKQDRRHDESSEKIKGAVASIVGFANLPSNDYHNLMQAVATMGPVSVTVAASSWGLYTGGVFNDDKLDHRDLNHAVVLEGYGTDDSTGEDYWIIRNSWGPTWGENGRIRLKRVDPTTLDDPSTDCKTDITPSDGIACTKDDDGKDVVPPDVVACGTSGVLFDSVIPIGGHLLS